VGKQVNFADLGLAFSFALRRMGALFMSSETNIADASFTLLAWLEKNKSRLLAVLVGAMVLGVGVAVVNQNSRKAELAASSALAMLNLRIDAEGEPIIAKSKDYLAVLEKHPNSAAAERALILLAGSLFEEGDYTAAAARFSEYLDRYPMGPMKASARMGKAACVDAEGKLQQALGEYQTIVESFPTDPVADQASMARAYLLEVSDKPAEALKIYGRLAGKSSESTLKSEAEQKQGHLYKLHPELKPADPLPVIPGLPAGLSGIPEMLQPSTIPLPTAPAPTTPAPTTPAPTTPAPTTPAPTTPAPTTPAPTTPVPTPGK
jgi:TolA-binding protein